MIHESDYQADHPCNELVPHKVSVNLDITMVFAVDARDAEDAEDAVTATQLVEWLNAGTYLTAHINDWTIQQEETTTA